MLGDANQLNENPYDAEAGIGTEDEDEPYYVEERARAAAWPVSPPVYPAECAEIGAEVATLLQTNLRNPHTVRDSAVLMYNEFARDGTLQPLHRDSAEGRPLETVEVEMGGSGLGKDLFGDTVKVPFATAEDYAPGVAAALLALYDELCSDAESAALDRPMVAVLTPHDHAKWGGVKPEKKNYEESDADFAARLASWTTANSTFRARLRTATVIALRAAAAGGEWGIKMPEQREAVRNEEYDILIEAAESDAAFALRLEAWQTTKSTFEAAALISGEIVATAVADDDASPWLVWTPVENFVGLDVPLVVMAGFDPMAERNKPKNLNYESTSEKRDPLAYMAMTRATHGTVVVEPHAARFARHYRIRAVEGGGFAAEDADGAMGEMSVVVDGDGRTRLCPSKVDFQGQGLTEFPGGLCDPLRAGTLRELDLGENQLTALPESIGALVGLEKLDLCGNQLTALPESIVALTALKTLHLRGNPLTKPQSPAVEAWLAALQRGGCTVSR